MIIKLNNFGKHVKKTRLYKDLTLDQLAARTKLSKSFLSELERGRKIPRLETVTAIASALDIYIYFALSEMEVACEEIN